jgi:hypothetical protein
LGVDQPKLGIPALQQLLHGGESTRLQEAGAAASPVCHRVPHRGTFW